MQTVYLVVIVILGQLWSYGFSASMFHCMIICSAKSNLILFLSYIAFTYLGTIGKKFLVAQNKQKGKKS